MRETPSSAGEPKPTDPHEPDRSGPVIRLPDDGAPEPTEEDLARLDAIASVWRRPDIQLLYAERDRIDRERIDREQQQQQVGDEQTMSSVRGVHIPGASRAVDEAKKPKMAKEPVKKGGKDSKDSGGKKPFPGAAPPFKKGGKRK